MNGTMEYEITNIGRAHLNVLNGSYKSAQPSELPKILSKMSVITYTPFEQLNSFHWERDKTADILQANINLFLMFQLPIYHNWLK